MFYKLRKDSFIRSIGEFGYIKSVGLFNDLVFDASGQAFLKALSREPQSLEDISEKIAKVFIDVTADDLMPDVKDFFDMLVEDGYVSTGTTPDETIHNDTGFSYSDIKQVTFEEDYSPKNLRGNKESQKLLDTYLSEHPQISNFQIELTSRCNERCIHCYIPHECKDTDISEKLYYSVLDQLSDMETLGVTLSGGEPMLHPKFKEFLKAAKDRDFYVHILSNLTLLDDEIIKIMKEGTCCGVQVSLYSMNPAHHDAITTISGSFEKTKNAILKLIENDIPVQISCPLMNANKLDFPDVCRWAHEHKIRAITDYAIMAEYNHDTSNLANRLSPEECIEAIKGVIEADETYREQISDDNFIRNINTINCNPDEPFCGVGINTCCMVAKGGVYPCPGWQGYDCGNLNERSLKEIWFESEKMNYLRSLRKRDLPECLKCENRAFCSPCLGRFANESKNGNPLEVATHFCQVAKVNREVVMEWRKKHNTEKLILYIDVLGYKQLSKSDKKADDLYNTIQKVFELTKKNKDFFTEKADISFKAFSDNIVMFCEKTDENFRGLSYLGAYITNLMIMKKYMIRGSLITGKIGGDDNLVYGQGLVEAYDAEEKSAYPLIEVVKKNFTEELLKDISELKYEDNGALYIRPDVVFVGENNKTLLLNAYEKMKERDLIGEQVTGSVRCKYDLMDKVLLSNDSNNAKGRF